MSRSADPVGHAPEPAWDVAHLFPAQGAWTEGDYLELTNSTNRLVELTDGSIEVLHMPTEAHQLIVRFLVDCLRAFVAPRKLGTVLFAPLRVRLTEGKFREPDVVCMLAEHAGRRKDEYWNSADLVMEVVSDSPEARRRDYERKPIDYAEAGIQEYWIIDPYEKRITVLSLAGSQYSLKGEYGPGQSAGSSLLDGFSLEVDAVMAASIQ